MNQIRRCASFLLVVFLAGMAAGTSILDDFEYMTVPEMCALLPQNTSFLRPNTCSHWVRCATNSSNMEEGACAAGLLYSKEGGRCTTMKIEDCPYSETNTATNGCAEQSDGTFLPDPTSCNGYILCKAHKEVHSNCPNKLVFDPTTRSCVYSSNYTCPNLGPKTATPVCRSLPNNTHLADDEQCNKYYLCINDVLHERECDYQMAYDVTLGRCVSQNYAYCYGSAVLPAPENMVCLDNSTGQARVGYFADEESCTHYYICGKPVNGKHDTKPQHLQCESGQYFDFEKLSCRDRLNVKCTLDRCVGNNLTYVNVAGDCQSYARCSSGVTVGHGRCPTDYYFDERSQGCTMTKHNYIACAA